MTEETFAPRKIVWILNGSIHQVVRKAYSLARKSDNSQAILFVPNLRLRELRPVIIAVSELIDVEGKRKYGRLDGYGNSMVYRVCHPLEVGYLAKRGGARSTDEQKDLNKLVVAGWNKTYFWTGIDDVDPRRD
jgi:hypothetical protein